MLTGVTWQLGIVILVLIEVLINLVLMLIEFHVIKGTGTTVLKKEISTTELLHAVSAWPIKARNSSALYFKVDAIKIERLCKNIVEVPFKLNGLKSRKS